MEMGREEVMREMGSGEDSAMEEKGRRMKKSYHFHSNFSILSLTFFTMVKLKKM